MKRTKYKPLLNEESITNLKFIKLNECEVQTNIHVEGPKQIGVYIWLFTNIRDITNYTDYLNKIKIDRDTEIYYLNRVIDKIVKWVLEENPSLEVAHIRKEEYVHYRHYGEFVAQINFKKIFFLKRLFSNKK